MNRLKVRKYEMIARVADFGARNASLFPKKTAAVGLVKDLQTVVGKMSESRLSQSAATEELRTSTKEKLEKHETLVRQLEAIHQTAEALNVDGFVLTQKYNSSQLCDIARSFIEAAGPLKAQFLLHGLPSNFIESLKPAAAELRGAIESQIAARDRRRQSAQDFDSALEEALTCLQRFDALVANTLSGDLSAMAAWEVARRLDPIRSVRKNVPAPPVNPSPPAPAVNTTAA
jgi:hypothetical protein